MSDKLRQAEDSKLHIIISEHWEITADTKTYILRYLNNGKSFVEGYYTRLDDLLNSLLDKRLRESDANSIKSLQKQLKLAREEISNVKEQVH